MILNGTTSPWLVLSPNGGLVDEQTGNQPKDDHGPYCVVCGDCISCYGHEDSCLDGEYHIAPREEDD